MGGDWGGSEAKKNCAPKVNLQCRLPWMKEEKVSDVGEWVGPGCHSLHLPHPPIRLSRCTVNSAWLQVGRCMVFRQGGCLRAGQKGPTLLCSTAEEKFPLSQPHSPSRPSPSVIVHARLRHQWPDWAVRQPHTSERCATSVFSLSITVPGLCISVRTNPQPHVPQPQHKPQPVGADQPTVPHTRGQDPVADMPDTLPGNWYQVLGVRYPGATTKEIKRAYKQLSVKLHPDKNAHHKEKAEGLFNK